MNKNYLPKYDIGYPMQKGKLLSHRELECLLPYLLNIPSKIISKQLNLSHRTVESYVRNIKTKTVLKVSYQRRLAFMKNDMIKLMLPGTIDLYLEN